MRVKRYIVDSMPDALQKIRSDLGKDAVILNTKEVRSGGFLGLFGKKRIEVIAATDTASLSGKTTYATTKNETKISTVQVADAVITNKSSTVSVLNEPLPFVPDVIFTKEVGLPQEQLAQKAKNDETILEEIRQMKDMMFKLSAKSRTSEEQYPLLEEIERRLLEQEIKPELVRQLITVVSEEQFSSGETFTLEQVKASVKQQLLKIMQNFSNKNIATDTQIAHFVGPTGVGKTTTIAKLAAEQVLKYHRKVGFITSDTYRIAAIEQLKTYATILNIPLEVVFSPQDLKKAFQQLQDRDIIFMDTAGRNFRNEMYVSELNALLQTAGKSETFLVLSLTTKYKDMKAITDNFSPFKLDKVLFTKMDETDSYGSIINLIYDFSLQLSYVTNGQNVPDDIVEANEEQITDLILEEARNE